MTVTVSSPQPGQNIGPGSQVRVATDLTGPFPITYQWRIQITKGDVTEELVAHEVVPIGDPQHNLNYPFGDPSITVQIYNFGGGTTLSNGDTVHVTFALQSDTGLVLDQTRVDAVWDDTQEYRVLPDAGGGGGGGFTQADRDAAQITQMAVSLPLPSLPGAADVASGITGFFTNPPSWAMQTLETQSLEGNGLSQRPGGGRGVDAYGCQIDFDFIPPELGRLLGNPDVYSNRICQLAVRDHGFGDADFYRLTADFYYDHQRLMWGTPFPLGIDFSVLPGCRVTLTWLHLQPGWWPF